MTIRTAEQFRAGQSVTIEPHDDDDPMAIEWKGRTCTVTLHAQSDHFNYVKVRDSDGHKATFRPQDVRARV